MIGELNLPNFKIKKHAKTPLYLRSVCCKKGVDELFDKLTMLKEAETTKDHSLQGTNFNADKSKDSNKKKPKISSIEKVKVKEEEKRKIVKSGENTPVIKYKNVEMPADLMEMDIFRKEIIKNIKKKRPDLKLENLESAKFAYFQHNSSHFQLCTQKSKEKKELTSRNSLNNAIYSIRALSSSSKSKIYQNLKNYIPYGTRFHIKK